MNFHRSDLSCNSSCLASTAPVPVPVPSVSTHTSTSSRTGTRTRTRTIDSATQTTYSYTGDRRSSRRRGNSNSNGERGRKSTTTETGRRRGHFSQQTSRSAGNASSSPNANDNARDIIAIESGGDDLPHASLDGASRSLSHSISGSSTNLQSQTHLPPPPPPYSLHAPRHRPSRRSVLRRYRKQQPRMTRTLAAMDDLGALLFFRLPLYLGHRRTVYVLDDLGIWGLCRPLRKLDLFIDDVEEKWSFWRDWR